MATLSTAKLHTSRSTKRVALAGAMALGAIAIPGTAPAHADPIDVPGIGVVDVPGLVMPPQALPFLHAISSLGQRALDAARGKVGAPYVWGATGPNAFDCSGLVQWAYAQAGAGLPRTSQAQAGAGHPVALNDLQPGDIVIYNGGAHAAIYAGGGQILHASTAGVPVGYAPLHTMAIYAARRI